MSRITVLSFLLLGACSTGYMDVQPGPAPEPAGFEIRAKVEGYAEYYAAAGPNLLLTPVYRVHGTASAVGAAYAPFLRIYLEGDAWIEPTPSGTAAINDGYVVVYRGTTRSQSGWQKQTVQEATSAPSGRRVYYANPASLQPTAVPCAAPRPPSASLTPCNFPPGRACLPGRCSPQ